MVAILFDSGKASLKKNLSTLGSITEILKEYPYSKLVEGHTDDRRSKNEPNFI
jgi:outer membrane protein OmpA-like peptidoglycan-associated protein